MERPHHGRRRSPPPRAQLAHRPHRRPVHRRYPLHGHQRGDSIHTARRADRRRRTPRRRRTLHRRRPPRRRLRRRRHGPQHLRHPQRNRHVRRAHPLRRRPRPPLLPPVRAHQPALPVPVHFPHRPGTALHRAAAFSLAVPGALRTRRLRRVALLHADRHYSLRVSPPPSRSGSPLSCVGIPHPSRHLRPLRRGSPHLQLRRQPERVASCTRPVPLPPTCP